MNYKNYFKERLFEQLALSEAGMEQAFFSQPPNPVPTPVPNPVNPGGPRPPRPPGNDPIPGSDPIKPQRPPGSQPINPNKPPKPPKPPKSYLSRTNY
jgi:hypothetical protein